MSSEDTQFKKGKSGNPNGRPTGSLSLNTRIKNLLEGNVCLPKEIQEAIDEKLGKKNATLVEAMVLAQAVEATQTGSTKACEFLFNRGYGKDPDKVEVKQVLDDEDKEILARYVNQKKDENNE